MDADRAAVVARRTLDVLGPQSTSSSVTRCPRSPRLASDDAFAAAIQERWLCSGADAAERPRIFDLLADLRQRLGDDESTARVVARAMQRGAAFCGDRGPGREDRRPAGLPGCPAVADARHGDAGRSRGRPPRGRRGVARPRRSALGSRGRSRRSPRRVARGGARGGDARVHDVRGRPGGVRGRRVRGGPLRSLGRDRGRRRGGVGASRGRVVARSSTRA